MTITTHFYLNTFERIVLDKEFFSEGAQKIGEAIVSQLKKENITYDEAYASLEYAYQFMKYQSEFLGGTNFKNITKLMLKKIERTPWKTEVFTEEVRQIGEMTAKQLNNQEITYDKAYASLEYAYQLLRYQSNFVKVTDGEPDTQNLYKTKSYS